MSEIDRATRPSGGNPALRALLEEAGLSNAALARAVVAAAAREGLHIGTNPTAVKRMLDGGQSRWPVPRLVAAVLSRRLQREISVAGCGFADRSRYPTIALMGCGVRSHWRAPSAQSWSYRDGT